MGLFTSRKKLEEEYGIPKKAKKILYYGGYSRELYSVLYYWEDKGTLFFADSKTYNKVVIYGSSVISFNTVGEYSEEQKISGGKVKGGGVSIVGAAAGGALLGPVGAIIGSRKKVKSEPIKSETIVTDNRRVVLNFIEKDKKEKLKLEYSVHDDLVEMYPEKDADTHKIVEKDIENNILKDDPIEQIKKLAELKESGIITETEFNNKKNELLSRL